MKKRILSLSLAIIMVCMCVESVHAEKIKMKQVYVPEKQVSIAFPENYITFEKEDTDIDPRLAAEGITLNGMKNMSNKYVGIFIFAFPPDFDGDLNVAIADTAGISSLAKLDPVTLSMLEVAVEKQATSTGMKLLSLEKVQIGENLFFVSKVHKNDLNMDCLQYMTVVDEQTISITLTRSYISDEAQDMLKQMMEASTFSKHAAGAAESKEGSQVSTGGNAGLRPEYYDEELGIHIVIPDGWEQLNLSKERQTLRMKMGRIDEPYCLILYSAKDLWGSLTNAQKTALGVTMRSGLDPLADNVDFMASLLGMSKSEVEMRKYAGKSYTMMTVTDDSPFGGKINVFTASTLKNGYLVIYQLYDLTNKYPDSFGSVLEGVYYD